MEVENECATCSRGMSDPDDNVQDTSDVDCYFTSGDLPKLQFRINFSTACWDDEMGMAEVVEKKGGMWTTTGIVRDSKIYCSTEETLFLAERGELRLSNSDDSPVQLKKIYKMAAEGKNGCWESFEVYRQLKSLGYIVGRHGIPWVVKSVNDKSAFLKGMAESKVKLEDNVGGSNLINGPFKNMRITEVRPVFDVYAPNSKFRKSCPGNASFVVCLTSGHPPSKQEIENLERECKSIPLKFCHIEHGRVSFFAFNRVKLPVLP